VTTPTELLATELARDGSRPLLTWYDDDTGERVELSVATTANWVAKTTGFLVDEHDVDEGDQVGVRLPLHWQTAVVLLAAWAAGAAVAFDQPGRVTVTTPGPDVPPDAVVLSLAPLGADFSRLVAAYPDGFVPLAPAGDDVVAAMPTDLPAGARVLTVAGYDTSPGLGYGLLAPLAGGGSVVLVGHPDRARLPGRCAAERVTHTVGVDVPGLPRLA